jgi:F-box-like
MNLPASCQLPDEIIKEVLCPGLHVPDALFADCTVDEDPFAKYELSSSTVLAVCKSWLRVATPLLYETVILRSKAQAQRLAWVLKNNSQLGLFIKKLRVEGGYGNSMFEILKRSPHTTDLSISTSLFSNESVAGYLKGFKLVKPQRLIVRDDSQVTNSKVRQQVYEALRDASTNSWLGLVFIALSSPCTYVVSLCPQKAVYLLLPGGSSASRACVLAEGLARGPSPIQYLRVYGGNVPLVFLDVLRLKTMKEMRIFTRQVKPPFDGDVAQFSPRLSEFERALLAERKLYDMTIYEK